MENNENEEQEINENALIEYISEEIEESKFDYSDVTEEEKEKLLEIRMRKGAIIQDFIITIGKDLSEAQKIYSKNGSGKFTKWIEQEYGIKRTTAFNYIKAYEVLSNCSLKGTIDTNNLEKLGVKKLASLSKLSDEQQKEVIENAPLEELNVKQVEELTKQIKDEQEYSEELVEEIKKKDEKIREKTKQQEEQQQTIKELQQKIQELESREVQPVAQDEPQIIEKVVEKEVVPEKVKAELETYKKLAQENQNNIPDYVLDELDTLRKTVTEQNEQLKDAKRTVEAIATQQNSKFGTQNIDWSLLGNVVNNFLSKASEYTYMKEAFKVESGKSKNFVKTQVDRIEKWVIEMKQMMNESVIIGNTIYVENEEITGGTDNEL